MVNGDIYNSVVTNYSKTSFTIAFSVGRRNVNSSYQTGYSAVSLNMTTTQAYVHSLHMLVLHTYCKISDNNVITECRN